MTSSGSLREVAHERFPRVDIMNPLRNVFSAVREIFGKIKFWRSIDRLGPDIPWTHWRLYFPPTMRSLCKSKFQFFGEGADFRPGAYAIGSSRIWIGHRVVVRPGCVLHADEFEGITIEDDVLLGQGVHIYVDNHRFDDPKAPVIDQGYSPSAPVTVKRGSWIGANVILLPGVTVGENAVVGAGSVVTRSVPDGALAVGSPARVIPRRPKT